MKHFFILFIGIFSTFSALAQGAAEFHFEPDSTWLAVPATEQDKPADLEIVSTSPLDQTIKWQRNVIMITPGGCTTQVCDLNACYQATVSSKQFPLAAVSTGPISVHLINTTGALCQAIIRLDMWNIDNPSEIVAAHYLFNMDTPSGINDVAKLTEIKVFPNPTSDYFTIANNEVKRIRMMTLDGREVARFNAEGATTFSVAGQQAGIYVLLMDDQNGKPIGVSQIDIN